MLHIDCPQHVPGREPIQLTSADRAHERGLHIRNPQQRLIDLLMVPISFFATCSTMLAFHSPALLGYMSSACKF